MGCHGSSFPLSLSLSFSVKHKLILMSDFSLHSLSACHPAAFSRLERKASRERPPFEFWKRATPQGNLIFRGPACSRSRRTSAGYIGRFIMHFLWSARAVKRARLPSSRSARRATRVQETLLAGTEHEFSRTRLHERDQRDGESCFAFRDSPVHFSAEHVRPMITNANPITRPFLVVYSIKRFGLRVCHVLRERTQACIAVCNECSHLEKPTKLRDHIPGAKQRHCSMTRVSVTCESRLSESRILSSYETSQMSFHPRHKSSECVAMKIASHLQVLSFLRNVLATFFDKRVVKYLEYPILEYTLFIRRRNRTDNWFGSSRNTLNLFR